MTGRPDLDGTLQVAADEFLKGIGANVVQIYLSTPGSLLRIAVSSGTPLSPEPKTNLQPGQGYAREAITRAPVLYIRDLERGDPAEGRGQAIATVYNAIHAGNPDAPLLAILQLDTLSKFAASDNATVLVPYESAALLGAAQALRSMIAAGPSADDSAPAR